MAISVFPTPTAAATEPAYVTAIPTALRTYQHIVTLSAGIYDVDITPTSTNAQLVFLDATSVLVTSTTSSGVVRVTLSTPSTRFFVTTLSGATSNASLKITKVAAPLTPGDVGNGTMDTINTTGTYNQTGLLTVLAWGGGAAGQKGQNGYNSGPGGAPGAIVYGVVQTNSATTVTVGAKGVAATSNNTNIVAPTDSSFGNFFTTASPNNVFTRGAGGNTAGQYNAGNAGNASSIFPSFNGNSTTGGGGSGANGGGAGGTGAGSGIGTGGNGGQGGINSVFNSTPTTKGNAATGKAAGGGGGAAAGNNNTNAAGRFGGDGADGVVYVLRGF
jgi:hypothetical protein